MSDGKNDAYSGKLYRGGTIQLTLDTYGEVLPEYEDREGRQ